MMEIIRLSARAVGMAVVFVAYAVYCGLANTCDLILNVWEWSRVLALQSLVRVLKWGHRFIPREHFPRPKRKIR